MKQNSLHAYTIKIVTVARRMAKMLCLLVQRGRFLRASSKPLDTLSLRIITTLLVLRAICTIFLHGHLQVANCAKSVH